ncbi:hypothetical protein MJO29_005597 [Puccinia striiformis f. sp. tritici]|uniref:Tet-like 2OG-Fe(II) oxygenase domain-containing protein n=1 Tax=Puccinia striiformis f. sp. tritici PST-78 TaxID=1165861 RepID=A0A0L0V6G2_9BASI|nr:hypothetical protein Pst134EA_009693 [Puccinia striiformis f. sp. tritici]KAI9611993.1 hypothetical protein H4Q26_008083 [Puccinia striiformis f. sp. tritici PST-130]KNE94858.1 hypothetical protein PSTG_11763 [Puccinia striiformis f. sp. tritici PST-78]KAH9458496.1 hypothetical protein Pst134EB_010799 [Puccinia striiformis f. sp. tritici]KAH9469164.1 hypothetical protein Pst134EA_009693 [Puccinia striiformis f. sp. tritici]KAI7960529.1 hypothetical protein MJO29_005597 [Puccinia striiformis
MDLDLMASGSTNDQEGEASTRTTEQQEGPRPRQKCADLRLAYRRRRGLAIIPHDIEKKFRKLDLFPEITKEITKEVAREEEERSKRVQEYEEHLRKYPDMQTFPKPTNRPIIPRLPTINEYDDALRHVEETFRIIDHGEPTIWDAKDFRVICCVEYIKISHLGREHRENLDSLCDFLHRCKQFISPLAAVGRPDGDVMSAIGWRQDMTHLEILDQYRDEEAIEANQGEYTNLMECSEKAGKAIWQNFKLCAGKVADETKEYLQNLSTSSSVETNSTSNPNGGESPGGTAASLAFPSNNFWIDEKLDKDTHENLPTGFALVIPTFKSTGKIASRSEGHQVDNGQFVFPHYKTAISFPPDFICGIIFSPSGDAYGTMKATEIGDSTRLAVCIQPVPKLNHDSKKSQPAPVNKESST